MLPLLSKLNLTNNKLTNLPVEYRNRGLSAFDGLAVHRAMQIDVGVTVDSK